MVESIKFDCKGDKNYISAKKKETVLRKGKTIEQYEELKKAIKEERFKKFSEQDPKLRKYFRSARALDDEFFKEVTRGLQNENLYKNLANKTIKFDADRINIIYGPNASGKTTVLKAIAANGLCRKLMNLDGFTNPEQFRIDLCMGGSYKDYLDSIVPNGTEYPDLAETELVKSIKKELQSQINFLAGNSTVIKWDGMPIYYENFNSQKINRVEDIHESIFGFGGSELESFQFLLNMDKLSMGQKSITIINKITQIAQSYKNREEFIKSFLKPVDMEQYEKDKNIEDNYDYRLSVYMDYVINKVIADYMCSGENKSGQYKMTFLLDEVDKSLDIANVVVLYRDLLPKFIKNLNVQLIMISHNPIVLSNICSEKDYNVISLDPEYTDNVKGIMKDVKF